MTPRVFDPLNVSAPPASDKKKDETLEVIIERVRQKCEAFQKMRRQPIRERAWGYAERKDE